ncbi:MAG: PrgI family protein [Candidatus Paceibacterota bacterium]
MQFQIPQFIEIENKIVGPLTLKQFLYLAVAAGMSFALYFVLALWLWIMVTAILTAVSVSLAFVKYNGQPLPKILLYAFGFFWGPKFYLWQKTTESQSLTMEKRETLKDFLAGAPSIKRLWQDLMTTKNPIPKREKSPQTSLNGGTKEKIQVFRKLTGEKEAARRVDYK